MIIVVMLGKFGIQELNATIRDINGNDIHFGNELRSDEHGYDVIVYDYDEDLIND